MMVDGLYFIQSSGFTRYLCFGWLEGFTKYQATKYKIQHKQAGWWRKESYLREPGMKERVMSTTTRAGS